ncbi:MAG: hypothetical protein H0Z32_13330 [Bacillaceae bacterium]|nr:hypothetical protein [Bacillaceae bacterium]
MRNLFSLLFFLGIFIAFTDITPADILRFLLVADQKLDEYLSDENDWKLPNLEGWENSQDSDEFQLDGHVVFEEPDRAEPDFAATGHGVPDKRLFTQEIRDDSRSSASWHAMIPEQNTPLKTDDTVTDDVLKEDIDSPEDILEKYREAFEELREKATERVQKLMAQAYQDYKSALNGEKEMSLTSLFAKYTTLAEELEKSTDQEFARIYSDLLGDLEKHGFSEDHATTVKEYYENLKSETKNQVVKEVSSMIPGSNPM